MIITIFTIACITPKSVVFAQQQTENKLGPDNFQEALKDAGSNVAILDSYAQTILDKELPTLNGITSINDELRGNITKNLTSAQANANDWLNDIKPNMRQSIKTVVNFNDVFQNHYDSMLEAIEQKNNQKLEAEISQLYQSILEYNQKVDVMVEDLMKFRDRLSNDVRSLKGNVNELQTSLSTSNADIPLMRKQIEYYNSVISSANGKIAGGAILCLALITCIAGGPMIDSAVKEKNHADEEIAKLEEKIAGIEKELILVTDIQSKLNYMADTTDKAINSLQSISNLWNVIGAKYRNLLDNVDNFDSKDFELLKEDLQISKASWEQLKQVADNLYTGLENNNIIEEVQ